MGNAVETAPRSEPPTGKAPAFPRDIAWHFSLPVIPSVALVFGLFLAWRAQPRPMPAAWNPLDALGFALGIVVAASGIVGLALPARAARLISPLSRTKPWLGFVVAVLTTGAAVVDFRLGRGALPLVCGSVFLSLLYWDRRPYLFWLLFVDAAVVAAFALLGAGRQWDALTREQVSLAAMSIGLGTASALTVRRFVAPGVERMRSLEQENRELWDLSFRDSLTGLYNRRFAEESGRKLFARAARYHERLHVLMIDIDHFKRVNDKLSHATGDEVLKEIAAIILSCVRSSDIAARFGGEEFVVFLIEAEAETAQFIANRLRDDVASRRFGSVPWQVTISIGVAGLAQDEDIEALIDRADKHLYVAKRAGRNRVSGF